jgi:hypothetical protein
MRCSDLLRAASLALALLAACEGKQEPADGAPDIPDAAADDPAQDEALPEEAADPVEDDVGPSDPADDEGDGLCHPNGDGMIERSELRFEIGSSATYVVNAPGTTAAVNVAGDLDAGVLHWDFTAATPDDRRMIDELLPLAGRWFEADFPGAAYATVLDPNEGILGIYRLTDEALLLMGMASEEDGRIRLTYDPAVEIIRFPVRVEDRWQVESTVSGVYNWLPSTANATYVVEVDASGVLRVPAGEFQVTRIRVDLSQSVPFTIFGMDNISYTFLAECYGVIARVRSTDGEENPDFTEAAEYRRLTL